MSSSHYISTMLGRSIACDILGWYEECKFSSTHNFLLCVNSVLCLFLWFTFLFFCLCWNAGLLLHPSHSYKQQMFSEQLKWLLLQVVTQYMGKVTVGLFHQKRKAFKSWKYQVLFDNWKCQVLFMHHSSRYWWNSRPLPLCYPVIRAAKVRHCVSLTLHITQWNEQRISNIVSNLWNNNKLQLKTWKLQRTASSIGFVRKPVSNHVTPTFAKGKGNFPNSIDRYSAVKIFAAKPQEQSKLTTFN